MARIENCDLVDPFTGRLVVRLTRREGESMVSQGTARRTSNRRYIQIKAVAPSDSEDDAPMLINHDMRVVSGEIKPTLEDHERLTGWGFKVRKPRQYQMA